MITKNPTEELLKKAAKTIRKLPNAGLKQKLTTWPDTIPHGIRIYGLLPRARRLKDPSPSQISAMDRILDALITLPEEYRKILWARAAGMTWERLCAQEQRCHVTLRKRHMEGLKKLERVLPK